MRRDPWLTNNVEREAPPGAAVAPCLVLGWGSDLRGDDAVGRRLAERVAGWAVPGVTAHALHQLTPELAEPIAAARRVVFLDAYPAAAPGDGVQCAALAPASASPTTLGHRADPAALLALAGTLYGRQPEAWLVGIPAHAFTLGAPLSSGTAAALDDAATRVRELIENAGTWPAECGAD